MRAGGIFQYVAEVVAAQNVDFMRDPLPNDLRQRNADFTPLLLEDDWILACAAPAYAEGHHGGILASAKC